MGERAIVLSILVDQDNRFLCSDKCRFMRFSEDDGNQMACDLFGTVLPIALHLEGLKKARDPRCVDAESVPPRWQPPGEGTGRDGR